MKSKFATAINCIDGRVQVSVAEFIKNRYSIDYVDMITVPGPDKLLSECKDTNEIESVKNKISISCSKHGSKHLFIVGHYDCAGNPCIKEEHSQQIKKAMDNIKAWGLNLEINGIWIDKEWKASLI